MKTILGIITVAALMSTSAMAKTNELQNMNYIVPASKWRLNVGLATTLKSKTQAYVSTQPKTSRLAGNTTKGTEMSFAGEYGFTDAFNAGVSMNYLIHQGTKDDMGTSAKAKGFSDPTVKAGYRYHSNDTLTGDAFVNVKPALFKAKQGGLGATTYGSETSNYAGRPSPGGYMAGGSTDFSLGTKLVYTMDSSEFGFVPALTARGKSKFTSRNSIDGILTESESEVESYMLYGADLSWRHHYNPTWYSHVGANVVGEVTTSTSTTSSTVTANGTATVTTFSTPNKNKATIPLHATPKLAVGYKCPTTGMVVELGGTYDNYNIKNQAFTAAGSKSGLETTTEYSNITAGLNVSYQL